MERLPEHGPCLVCGTSPNSFGFVFYKEGDRIIVEGTLTRAQQGPPGHAHGGSLAAILDEAMGRGLWELGHKVVAAHLEFDYRHPTPLNVPLRVIAEKDHQRKKSIHCRARIELADGTVTVEGRGVFVEMGDQFFEKFGDFWGKPQ
ncbi:MAG: Thioesterase superfamily protein [Cyanobacteria bacterium RYN_339]|nr:Thioesterase superfamily protein [Cyanobacteria bacterium RYN_339]